MIKHKLVFGALALAATAVPSAASAATVVANVNTGQGATGTSDPKWTINGNPAWIPTGVNSAWAFSTGNTNADGARWISPNGSATHTPNTNFAYTTVFTLSNAVALTSAILSGRFWSDNGVINILLNGKVIFTNPLCTTSANVTSCSASALTNVGNQQWFNTGGNIAFGANSGFNYGANTLTFNLRNGPGTSGNPSGLRVLGNVTAAVPEPSTWMLMLLGFAAIGFSMRRRSKTRVNFQFA